MAKNLRNDLILAGNTLRHYLTDLKRSLSTLDDVRLAIGANEDFSLARAKPADWWSREIRRRTRGLVGKKLLAERHALIATLRFEAGLSKEKVRTLKRALDLDTAERNLRSIEQRLYVLEAKR